MMYKCIMKSLLVKGKTKVIVWLEEYSIIPNKPGNLLIKLVISESHLHTNATTSKIRIQLIILDYFMAICGQDI